MAKRRALRKTRSGAGGLPALRRRVALLERRQAAQRKAAVALREGGGPYRALFESSDQGICIHRDFTILFANPALARMFGLARPADVIGFDLRNALPAEERGRLEEYSRARLAGRPAPLHYECDALRKNGSRIRVQIMACAIQWDGQPAVLGTVTDITQHRQAEGLAAGQVRLLEMIGGGSALPEVLDALVRLIEAHGDGMLASVLLLDEDGVHLRHGAAPSLPESYNRMIDGVAIGPSTGSCGTAAYLGQPTVVSKIATDPLWADYRELALAHDLQACWSTPIISRTGRVLGTFALYYREPREPGLWELQLIETATRLARIAIEHSRAEAMRASEERYRLLFERTMAGVYRSTPDGRMLECNPALARLLGYASPVPVLALSAPDLYADPADRERLLARLAPGESLLNEEVRWRKADGGTVWVLLSVRREGYGASECLEGIAIDITDRRRAEEAQRESAALRSVAHLANAAGHEINNPLTTVIGRLDMLIARLPAESGERDLAQKARAASDRIRDIVQRMHSITRFEYLIDPDRELPPILDIRKSSADSSEAPPSP
ncbi:MAG TPA: PAS domain S-box protein [Methylomirabilota bacterium]|nr:PAS domain S-box protein [Methylomirabilota bacterium]